MSTGVASIPASDASRRAAAQFRRDRALRFVLCFGPPMAYLTLFMSVPYLDILSFSFWKVDSYVISREFNFDNYQRVFANPLYRRHWPAEW